MKEPSLCPEVRQERVRVITRAHKEKLQATQKASHWSSATRGVPTRAQNRAPRGPWLICCLACCLVSGCLLPYSQMRGEAYRSATESPAETVPKPGAVNAAGCPAVPEPPSPAAPRTQWLCTWLCAQALLFRTESHCNRVPEWRVLPLKLLAFGKSVFSLDLYRRLIP